GVVQARQYFARVRVAGHGLRYEPRSRTSPGDCHRMTRISRHFNYTHRVRIPASKIHVEIERGEDGKYRGVLKKLDLTEHGRHAEEMWKDAQVVVEARRVSTGSYHRQILGSVVETQKKPITPIELAEFPDESEIVFRFKVVDP